MRWPSLGPARTPCATVFFAQSGGAVPSIRWARAAGGQRANLVRLEYAQQRLRPVPVVPDAFLDRLAAQAGQSQRAPAPAKAASPKRENRLHLLRLSSNLLCPPPPPLAVSLFPHVHSASALPFRARPAPGRKDEVLPGREGHEVGLVGHCVDDLRSPTITRVPTPFPRGAPPRSCACSKLVGCCPLAWPGAPPVGFYLAYYHWTSINRSLSMHMGEILIVSHPT